MSKNKKIIYFITKSNWGGAQKYVFDLATNIAKKDYDVMVILGGNGVLKQKLESENINTISLGNLGRDINILNDFKSLIKTYKILKKEKPDVIHLNSSKAAMISVIGRLAGIKNIIFTAHGWAFNEDRSFLSKILIKFIYLITIICSHTVIAVSKKIISQVENWPFTKNKMKLIYPGTEAPVFLDKNIARDFFIKKLHIETVNPVWFLSIGELHPIKGHIYAIESFKKMSLEKPDLNFVYIIIGGGELKQELQMKINELNLRGKVFLADYLENASSYLKAADYYLFPSLSEAFGYALVEAGQAKLPVIASNVGGLPEVVDNNTNGLLVESRNMVDLYEKINIYLDDKNLGLQYSELLYSKILSNFSVDKMVDQTMEIYK
jgi:glycosyltransferase involved in cell wall biosynthesis